MLFADRLEVWNPGELPASLSPERLRRPHASIPRNPLLAEPLFLAGYIEQAGTGTLDMIARCRDAGLKPPQFRQDGGSFIQTLWRPAPLTGHGTPQVTPQVTPQDNSLEGWILRDIEQLLGLSSGQATPQVTAQVTNLLNAAREPVSREDLQQALGMRDREHFRQNYLEPLLIPDKPTSRLQRYRLTAHGRAWLEKAAARS
jgi:predicted HTH transcriptional regulator